MNDAARDLFASLDLDGKASGGSDPLRAVKPSTPGAGASGSVQAGPRCLKVDEWGMRRGREVSERGAGVGPEAAADFFTLAFDAKPELTGGCTDARRYKFISEALQSPEVSALRARTVLDDTAAEVAARDFSRAFRELEASEERRKARSRPGRKPGPGDAQAEDGAVSDAISDACAAASGELETMDGAATACGLGRGEPGHSTDPARVAEVYRRVRGSATLAQIVEEAGRYRLVGRSLQRAKFNHGQDEVFDLGVGAEISRLVPLELSRMVMPSTRLDTFRRISQRQALVKEMRSPEPAGRGPVVVVVDESRSMEHDKKLIQAKALALSVAYLARQQRRWVALASFAAGPATSVVVLKPGRWDESALIDWLTRGPHGGTTGDVVLNTIPFSEWPKLIASGAERGKTDLLVVTDGAVADPGEMSGPFLAWKKAESVKLTTIAIGTEPGPLGDLSDRVYQVPCLSLDSEGVSAALSLG